MREVTQLSAEVLAALRRQDTPTLSNAIETFDVRPRDEGFANMEVRCMFPDLGVMVGYAATAPPPLLNPAQPQSPAGRRLVTRQK